MSLLRTQANTRARLTASLKLEHERNAAGSWFLPPRWSGMAVGCSARVLQAGVAKVMLCDRIITPRHTACPHAPVTILGSSQFDFEKRMGSQIQVLGGEVQDYVGRVSHHYQFPGLPTCSMDREFSLQRQAGGTHTKYGTRRWPMASNRAPPRNENPPCTCIQSLQLNEALVEKIPSTFSVEKAGNEVSIHGTCWQNQSYSRVYNTSNQE
jgi:hypothetical protein